ncbi:MAG: right-handed parallel beta-helix repeat-containing protein [Prolixibacteraceae bacterium]|nr:right-handed parallel beta-helix repeat-containing protein [Prolixibacteraceae bacterium]
MKIRIHTILTLLAFLSIIIFSCEDDNYISSDDARLSFSTDTLMFDTIFTTIGSTTKSIRVINPHNKPILISSIQLGGLDESSYRLNIDGEMANEAEYIEIAAKDSMYIFVELIIDPNGSNQPMVVSDSIVFITNSNIQNINLMAWGQDFYPINAEIIETTTWTNEKPYLIFDIAVVDSNQTLTIQPGTKIFFHKDARLAVLGTIHAIGTPDMPIRFSGDRLEALYGDIPDQWSGINLFPNESTNILENVEIVNARIGVQAGAIEYEGTTNLKLHNARIEHMGYAGIFAINANIEATNTLVADCGFYGIALLAGGNYDFTHCTVANYWGSFSNRQSSSVVMSNLLAIPQEKDTLWFFGDLTKADWNNSIIWGNIESEIEMGNNEGYQFNYKFTNSLVKISDTLFNAQQENFESSIINIDPGFIDYTTYDYQLDTLSPAKDAGLLKYGEKVPYDLNNNSRLSDDYPDLGAYERIEKKSKDSK